jgi:amino acid transporter
VKTSSRWHGILILAMFLLGVLIVILNYAGLLPGGVNNAWLVAAIGAIFVGLILATRYH